MKQHIQILSMLMAVDRGYNPQFLRPYETTGTGDAVNLIRERVDFAMGQARAITGGLIGNAASGFVTPQADPGQAVMMPNGWGTARFIFFMEVAVSDELGGRSREIIQGWTEHADISYSGRPDPNMRFVVNSITRLKDQQQYNRHGGLDTLSRVTDAFHIVNNDQWDSIETLSNPNVPTYQSMRPGDVYKYINSHNHLSGSQYLDMNTTMGLAPRASRRSNGLASQYAGTLINGWVSAASASMFDVGGAEMYSNAAGLVLERSVNEDPFMNALAQINNRSVSKTFTLNELFMMDPAIANNDPRFHCFTGRDAAMVTNVQPHDPGNMMPWHGVDKETQSASIIVNGLPTMMIEAGIGELAVVCTNLDAGGPMISCQRAVGIAKQEVGHYVMGIQARIQAELLDHISYHNQIGYFIEIHANLMHATRVVIQLENNPAVEFSSPTFCDALMSPVITTDPTRLGQVASDFDSMLESVVQIAQPTLDSLQGMAGI